ncbi:lytic polysaccharide monooxygenase [Kribbella sp. NBC_00662]
MHVGAARLRAWVHDRADQPGQELSERSCAGLRSDPVGAAECRRTQGVPAGRSAGGSLCSAGLPQFAELDDQRGGTWPATQLQGGQGFTFSWHLTAAHATTDFKYYMTKQGWDPTQPLTRSALELEPFLTVPMNGARPATDVSHPGTIPTGRTGRHMILAVWTIADTANAFYQCSDVNF